MSIIVKLEAQNVKRLKAVSITPSAGCNIIGGKNAQGKTSLLDTIEMALSGKKSIPDMPIRNGEKNARIVLETEDLIVTRTFTASGSNLTVTNREGLRHTKAQGVLDDLIGRLTLDPLAFTRLDAKKQAETLRDILGIDTTSLDAKRQQLFEDRTDHNRKANELKSRLDALVVHEGVPSEEVSVASLVEKMNAANDANRKISQGRELVSLSLKKLADIETQIESLKSAYSEIEDTNEALTKTVEGLGDPVETGDIRESIANAEDTNSKVRENAQHKVVAEEYKAAQELSEKRTNEIAEIDTKKQELLSSAKYPVDGVGIGDDGEMTYNGVPFSQASAAEQLRVSAAMGLALNPKLRVLLIRDGSLLDSDSMAELEQFATNNEAQVWIERVGDADAGAIIIEDGMVV